LATTTFLGIGNKIQGGLRQGKSSRFTLSLWGKIHEGAINNTFRFTSAGGSDSDILGVRKTHFSTFNLTASFGIYRLKCSIPLHSNRSEKALRIFKFALNFLFSRLCFIKTRLKYPLYG
jgi:hypothetical protein